MAHVITFRSSRFDTAAETPNPINPIAGESVLSWLSEGLASAYEVTAPATEDWGGYGGGTGGEGRGRVVPGRRRGAPGRAGRQRRVDDPDPSAPIAQGQAHRGEQAGARR